MSTSHLEALQLRLSNERIRLAASKTPQEREMRTVWVQGVEKEITSEIDFLAKQGIIIPTSIDDIDEDELLAELLS